MCCSTKLFSQVFFIDNYDKGRSLAKMAEVTFNVETDEGGEVRKKKSCSY